MRLLIVILAIFFLGCSSKSEGPSSEKGFNYSTEKDNTAEITVEKNDTKNEVPVQALNYESNFLAFYKKFIDAFASSNNESFDDCIYSDNGFYVVSSYGALPQVSQFYALSEFNADKNMFATLAFWSLDPSLSIVPEFDSLPTVICDEEVYDKQGCFSQEVNTLIESQIWNYAGLNEKEIQFIEFLAKTVKITVINTSNFTFYFSKIEEKWYLTFLDMRIPCTA